MLDGEYAVAVDIYYPGSVSTVSPVAPKAALCEVVEYVEAAVALWVVPSSLELLVLSWVDRSHPAIPASVATTLLRYAVPEAYCLMAGDMASYPE